jgi:hypothetical protein
MTPLGPHPTRRRPLVRRPRFIAAVAVAVVVIVILGVVVLLPAGSRAPGARACVYTGATVSGVRQADRVFGQPVRCAVLFDDAAQTWSEWDNPWFISNRGGDTNWTNFARSGNRVVVTVNLFPTEADGSDWRTQGADGAFSGYASTLARNLVHAGMGRAVIRLGHEANGTWYPDNVGDTALEESEWAEFWRRTVTAMRTVPGAHFSFDWCVNAGVRPIPFAAYYPGDAYVDTIGVDVYDAGVPAGVTDRWGWLYRRPEGVGALVRFARAHHKPLALPEWGLEPKSAGGIGADPGFTRGILQVLKSNDVSFESYFFVKAPGQALLADPTSLRIYRSEILR